MAVDHSRRRTYAPGTLVKLLPTSLVRRYYRLQKYENDPSTIGEAYANTSRIKPFNELQKIVLSEMRVHSAAVGKYVLVRVLELDFREICWSSVIEDETGGACFLDLYNYSRRELFSVGTVLIIKEPFCSLAAVNYPLIQCHCSTDVIVLKIGHPLLHLAEAIEWENELDATLQMENFLGLSADQWIENGNEWFQDGFSSLALEVYLLGLNAYDMDHPKWITIQSKLSTVYFYLGYYEKTIATAEFILDDDTALFNAGKALYQLRKYHDAFTLFGMISNAKIIECINEWSAALMRVIEQNNVSRSIERLSRESLANPFKNLHHADYVGPLKKSEIASKGRGVVLTDHVDAETVLIVSKAFVAKMGPKSQSTSEKVDIDIVTEIVQAVLRNPKTFGPMIFDLSTGVELHQQVEPYYDLLAKETFVCDVERIKAIWRCNKFTISFQVDGEMKDVGAGLFIFPSYIDDSCEPNAYCRFYNDVMVVRAIGQLKAGEELCINRSELTKLDSQCDDPSGAESHQDSPSRLVNLGICRQM